MGGLQHHIRVLDCVAALGKPKSFAAIVLNLRKELTFFHGSL
jgi:hypothetical protein